MKKLIRSLVVALGGVFIAATASEAASISFSSYYRSAIDANNIFSIPTRPGDPIPLSIAIDTRFLYPQYPNRQVSIQFSVTLDDPAEIGFPITPAYPLEFNRLLPQNQIHYENFSVTALNNLQNDGRSDLSLRFKSASLISDVPFSPNIDLSTQFWPVGFHEGVDFKQQIYQEVPEPGTMLGAAIALGWGAWLKRKNASQ